MLYKLYFSFDLYQINDNYFNQLSAPHSGSIRPTQDVTEWMKDETNTLLRTPTPFLYYRIELFGFQPNNENKKIVDIRLSDIFLSTCSILHYDLDQ